MHQSRQDHDQVLFRDILLRLRNAQLTTDDWEQLMKQTPAQAEDLVPFKFTSTLRLTLLWSTMLQDFVPVANQ